MRSLSNCTLNFLNSAIEFVAVLVDGVLPSANRRGLHRAICRAIDVRSGAPLHAPAVLRFHASALPVDRSLFYDIQNSGQLSVVHSTLLKAAIGLGSNVFGPAAA